MSLLNFWLRRYESHLLNRNLLSRYKNSSTTGTYSVDIGTSSTTTSVRANSSPTGNSRAAGTSPILETLAARCRGARSWPYACSAICFQWEPIEATRPARSWEVSASASLTWVVSLLVSLPLMNSSFPLVLFKKIENE